PRATIPKDSALRVNPFMQTWKPYKHKLPRFMRNLTEAAEKWGLRLEGLAFSRDILRAMVMWYHCEASPRIRRLAVQSNATSCLKNKHRVMTVGDFERIAVKRSEPTHRLGDNGCLCEACTEMRRDVECLGPDDCYRRAEAFLDTLPPKWDPRGEHPEDYEEMLAPRKETGWTYFDRRVTTRGHVSDAFRIFTRGSVCNERLSVPTVFGERMTEVEAATDGSCINNGARDARAGAGVSFSSDTLEDLSLRLPVALEQSNQTGEMLAAKAAS
ncbi:uncharacterized protein SCHCODRAFT_02467033, partial [Schizophyllum commune H4-8]|uniref:uncharacterized protein n=1 Tax=Schizophyllum commune (strain H4-8 / FGSC 9210) TaxID=578458 RepID=UPI002160D915